MPRLVAVVLVVGLLVWGLAFVDFGRPRTRRAAGAVPEAVEPATTSEAAASAPPVARAPEPTTKPPSTLVGAAVPEPGAAASPPRAASSTGAAPMARTQGGAALAAATTSPAPARGALSTQTGELGEGSLSPEYAEMERSYAHEPRDGTWAEAEEQRLRAVLAKSSVAAELALVNCQETLCRLLLESDDYELYARLIAVPGLVELTGLRATSAYSHRSGQLSVYFPRRDAAAQAAR